MSISSVPGTNSVFFASLPIDSLPIDKIWERVCRVVAPVKSRGRKASLLSNQLRRASPRLSERRVNKSAATCLSYQPCANRSCQRKHCEPYIDLKVIRADFIDIVTETAKNVYQCPSATPTTRSCKYGSPQP